MTYYKDIYGDDTHNTNVKKETIEEKEERLIRCIRYQTRCIEYQKNMIKLYKKELKKIQKNKKVKDENI